MFGEKEFGHHVGFPTPEETPEERTCLTFNVPANAAWWGVMTGLVIALTEEENWQQFEGGMSVEDAAADASVMVWDALDRAAASDSCLTEIDAPFWDESSGDDADDQAPPEEQSWFGVWDGETFVEALSYWAVTAFLMTGVSEGAAIRFITPLRTFRLTLKKNQHGAKLLALMDSNIFQLIDLFSATDETVQVDIVSPGSTLMLVHSGEHNPDATPNTDGFYEVNVIKSELTENDVVPPNIRWTDTDTLTFQTTDDGGSTWDDNPTADPRYNPQGLLKPLTPYSGIECDVAERMAAQLKATLDIFIATGDAAQFATGVLALLVFPFGLAGWFLDALILVANVLIDIGQADIEAAFTSTVYDDIKCAFSCFIDSNGQIKQSALDAAYNQIQAAHPGVVATTIDELRFFYGDVPMNNAGVSRTETGDCSACPSCDWIVEWDFTGGNTHDWQIVMVADSTPRGSFIGGRFIGTHQGGSVCLTLMKALAGIHVTESSVFIESFHGTGIGNVHRTFDLTDMTNPGVAGTVKETDALISISPAQWQIASTAEFDVTLGYSMDWICDSNDTGRVNVYKLRLAGTGTPPSDGVFVDSLT